VGTRAAMLRLACTGCGRLPLVTLDAWSALEAVIGGFTARAAAETAAEGGRAAANAAGG